MAKCVSDTLNYAHYYPLFPTTLKVKHGFKLLPIIFLPLLKNEKSLRKGNYLRELQMFYTCLRRCMIILLPSIGESLDRKWKASMTVGFAL